MINPIYATWCLSNNIGDALTPWLIEKMAGQMPLFVPYSCQFPKFMVFGSILNHAVKYTTVWGAGIANEVDKIDFGVDIRSVRGPLTARKVRYEVGNNVLVVGDPAWMLPVYYKPSEGTKQCKVGIVPHYIHQAEVAQWIGERTDIKLINVFDSPEKFIDDVCNCDVIYSSSLHGLVIADAYGIPSQWIDCTGEIGGDGWKFKDHLLVRDFVVSNGVYAPKKLQKYIVADVAELLDMTPSEPIVRLHLRQLPKKIDDLRDAIKDKPAPTLEAVNALCAWMWSVCPFNPDPVPVLEIEPEPEPIEEIQPQKTTGKTTRYTTPEEPETQEKNDGQSQTIHPNHNDPGQGKEAGPTNGCTPAPVAD